MQVDSWDFGPMLVRPRKWHRQEFHDLSTKHDELRMVVESYHLWTEACTGGKVLDISLPRFKLSIVLHSASVEKISGPGLVQAGESQGRKGMKLLEGQLLDVLLTGSAPLHQHSDQRQAQGNPWQPQVVYRCVQYLCVR